MWFFAKRLRQLRAMQITATSEAAGAAMIRVAGVVSSGLPLLSPVTGTSCGFVETELREWDNGTTYPFSTERRGAFGVRDDTGIAWIEALDAEFAVSVTARGHSADDEVIEHMRRYVSELGRSMFDDGGALRSLAWKERRLSPGDHACIVGVARHEAHPDGETLSYRHAPSRLVVSAALIADRRSCRCPPSRAGAVHDRRSPWQTR